GLPAPGKRALLLTPRDAPVQVAPDARFDVPLDTLGGTITLLEHQALGDRVVWSHAYPASDTSDFLMGTARTLSGETTWARGAPQMSNWLNVSGYLLGCHVGTGLFPRVDVHGVLGACGDGSITSSYVELTVPAATSQLAGLELRVADAGTNVGVPLFP